MHDDLLVARLAKLRSAMESAGVAAVLTADPINIGYATGSRNMTVFGLMGSTRFALVLLDGPVVMWEFAGCEHLLAGLPTVDEIRIAPGITSSAGGAYRDNVERWVGEVAELVGRHAPGGVVAIEKFDLAVTDALRARGLTLVPGTEVVFAARITKLPGEIELLHEAARRVEHGLDVMAGQIAPGRTEIDVWADFHRELIAGEGEYISTRLAQAGARTYPYFNEAGPNPLASGDLYCIDTDAVGYAGYAVDISRAYLCGDADATADQQGLHRLTFEQLRHNAALIAPGVSFESFARNAWRVPSRLADYRYYCLAHGIGVSGEGPNLGPAVDGVPYQVPGEFVPGMVICVESYLGDAALGFGIKLEDQYVVTDHGTELMTAAAFDARLS
jgi:Xaa-Pro dipeptidase